jgi:hypothetical protein
LQGVIKFLKLKITVFGDGHIMMAMPQEEHEE